MGFVNEVPYGAFEQKRCYQKHLLSGSLFSVVLALCITGAVWLLADAKPPKVTGTDGGRDWGFYDTIQIHDGRDWRPPLSRPGVRGHRPSLGHRFSGNVEPVSGTESFDTINIIDWGPNDPDGFYSLGGDITSDGEYGPNRSGRGPGNDVIPPSDTFIPHEEPPVLIKEFEPEYPGLALEGGFTSRVKVNAFVGSDGLVKKVEIVACNRPSMGFEEEAKRAAMKAVYRPAIQNKYPIGVWISYTIVFKLSG